MAKIETKHAKGYIDNRYFIAITETINNSTRYLALEKTSTGWKRNYVSRDRLAKLYRTLISTTASA